MRSVEDTRPRRGLSVPVVTVLGRSGELAEEDQRRLVRFVIQDGNGADVIFAAGTTGEWDRLPAALQRRVVRGIVGLQTSLSNCRRRRETKQSPVGSPLINNAHANPAHWLIGVYRKSLRVQDQAADGEANALSRRQRGGDELVRQLVRHPQQFER